MSAVLRAFAEMARHVCPERPSNAEHAATHDRLCDFMAPAKAEWEQLRAENARLVAALAEVRGAARAVSVVHCGRHNDDTPLPAPGCAHCHAVYRLADALASTPPDLAAGRDRRVRAGALRDAAERWDAATARDPGRGSAAWEASVRPWRDEASAWLRAEAERVERG